MKDGLGKRSAFKDFGASLLLFFAGWLCIGLILMGYGKSDWIFVTPFANWAGVLFITMKNHEGMTKPRKIANVSLGITATLLMALYMLVAAWLLIGAAKMGGK